MQTLIHIGCSARLSRNVRICNFLLCCNPLARKMGSKHRGDSEVARLSRLRTVQQISSLRSRDSRKVDPQQMREFITSKPDCGPTS
jgi:hypothetical protein